MKITVKTGVICALIWIAFKLILFVTLTGEARYDVRPAVMVNILLLLLSITVGLYLQKRRDKEETNALADIKNAMSAGVPYAVIVSLFLFFYYKNIDPEFNQHQIAERSFAFEKAMNDPLEVKRIKDSNAEFEVMTKEEIIAKNLENMKATISPGSTMTLSLLAMLLLSTINSIFVTVVYRRVVFR